jgi:ribose/xylose/arabinose/galactoside ABC-type transport system permease subunit
LKRSTIGPVILLAVSVTLSLIFVERFGSGTNISYLLLQAVPLLLTASGQTLVILTGGIDLSVGASVAMAGVVASGLMLPEWGLAGVVIALLACLLVALAIGSANAVMVVRFHLPPFLATLGTTFFLAGVALYFRPVPGGTIDPGFQSAVTTRWGYIPPVAVLTLVGLGLLAVYVNRSRLGLRLRAVGGDEGKARRAGVDPGFVKLVAYVISALLAMLAGLFIAGRTGSGDPLVGGSYQLASITAAVLGGASLAGGRGSVWGAVIGALVLAMLSNVLNLLGVVAYWQWVIQGAVLLLAVGLYSVEGIPGPIRRRTAAFHGPPVAPEGSGG